WKNSAKRSKKISTTPAAPINPHSSSEDLRVVGCFETQRPRRQPQRPQRGLCGSEDVARCVGSALTLPIFELPRLLSRGSKQAEDPRPLKRAGWIWATSSTC